MTLQWIFVYIFIGAAIAIAELWQDGDSIIIYSKREPDITPSAVMQELRKEDEDTIITRSHRCVTPNGAQGQCKSLKECYPSLFPIDSSDLLAEQLIAASGYCGNNYRSDSTTSVFNKAVSLLVLICCAVEPMVSPHLPHTQFEQFEQFENATYRTKKGATENGCGHIKIQPQETKIVGGREAERGEFPWIVALMEPNKENTALTELCGGSLIDDLHVLTAAHCVKNLSPSDVAKLIIQIGDHDIYSTNDGPHEVRKAACIIYHSGYSNDTLNHDIALIRLSIPVKVSKYIQPVCLHPGKPSYDNINADVAGWGQLEDDNGKTEAPSKLQTVSVKILSHEACIRKHSNRGESSVVIGEGMVCAGSKGKDSCFGDSGGPLTIKSRTKAQQVGIVSWGIDCGSYPGVYTRVDKYITWINKNRMHSGSFAE